MKWEKVRKIIKKYWHRKKRSILFKINTRYKIYKSCEGESSISGSDREPRWVEAWYGNLCEESFGGDYLK